MTPKYRCTIAQIVPVNGAADLHALDAAVSEEAVDQQSELVGGALAQRLQPPALDQRGAVEHAEHDVGVADING